MATKEAPGHTYILFFVTHGFFSMVPQSLADQNTNEYLTHSHALLCINT